MAMHALTRMSVVKLHHHVPTPAPIQMEATAAAVMRVTAYSQMITAVLTTTNA